MLLVLLSQGPGLIAFSIRDKLVCQQVMRFNFSNMSSGPTSIANVVYLIGDTLQADYGIDPAPLYEELGVPPDGPRDRADRFPNTLVNQMWERAATLTKDPAFGIKTGLNLGSMRFFILGHTWLASETLLDAINRLIRYEEIIDSGITDIRCERAGDNYVVSEAYPNPADYPGKLSVDMSIAAILNLSKQARGQTVLLERLEIYGPKGTPLDMYQEFVRGPIVLSDDRNAMFFSAEDLEAPLRGSIPEVVDATTQIAEDYLRALDTSKVTYRVRELLVQMLPSGSVDQEAIAQKLYCSASTLQRQLGSEGTSYRDVLSDTREQLAKGYLKDDKHSHAEIAFLLGFSDQSNFSRAFKRWTGQSPGQYQKAG